MKDVLIVLGSFVVVLLLAFWRTNRAGGFPLLPKSKIQSIFKKKDSN